MKVELIAASRDELPILENLAQLYQYDFSEFALDDVDDYGLFGVVGFETLFDKPQPHAFLVKVDGHLAGFATAYRGTSFRDPAVELWWMDEFFVMRKYRRKGVGEIVAGEVFDRLPGAWEVGQIASNKNALQFWRRVIDRYTDGDYEEITMDDHRWRGTVQYFTSKKAPR